MFYYISGEVAAVDAAMVVIDAGGVGYALNTSYTSARSVRVGDKATFYTYLRVAENIFELYGFARREELDCFKQLLTVSGVGPKAALKILSNITASGLASVLDEGDLARLEKIPGIGKKTAQKMLLALKGKLSIQEDTVRVPVKALSPWQDVMTALCSMGYDKRDVEPLIARLSAEIDTNLSRKEQEDALFRRAIVELAN